MIVKNWMLEQQFSISSDALAIEAVMLIREHNLKMLPVVDEGRLRGVVHRRDLSEAAQCVTDTGDVCEMNYFCNKLKVKDVMVRMPVTVDINETVENTLMKGRDMTMSTFPVMDGDKVVGVVSDREIFITLYKLLEADKKRARVTLTGVTLETGTLREICEIAEAAGARVRSVFTVPDNGQDRVRVVLRADMVKSADLRQGLEAKGFSVLEYGD